MHKQVTIPNGKRNLRHWTLFLCVRLYQLMASPLICQESALAVAS